MRKITSELLTKGLELFGSSQEIVFQDNIESLIKELLYTGQCRITFCPYKKKTVCIALGQLSLMIASNSISELLGAKILACRG